jgi:hypothetical protein
MGAFPVLGFLGYGKRFQKHRKLFHSAFSQAQCHTFEKIQMMEARVLVNSLIITPESYDWHVRRFVLVHQEEYFDDRSHRFATTVVMKIAYGHRVQSDDDGYIKLGERFSHAFRALGSPGGTPPDFLPLCMFISAICVAYSRLFLLIVRHIPPWFPGAWWSRHGRDWKATVKDFFELPFEHVRRQMVYSLRTHQEMILFQ